MIKQLELIILADKMLTKSLKDIKKSRISNIFRSYLKTAPFFVCKIKFV